MARAGITLLDVEKAILQLQGRGKNPTVDAIRELLGTGSKSTIIQHLKTWRSKSDASQGRLPQELLALVSGLWERLNLEAEQRIINIENNTEQQLTELKTRLQLSERQHLELTTRHHQVEEKLSDVQQINITLEKDLQHEQQEHAKLNERHQVNIQQLDDFKSENARLHQLATNIQANLEHYQHAMQQARAEQTLSLEKQQNQFQQEIFALQREIALLRKQSHETDQVLNQITIERQQLREQFEHLQHSHQDQTALYQNATHELILLRERNEHQQRQLDLAHDDIQNKTAQILTFEKQNAILLDQRDRFQNDLVKAEDKIELLRQEKSFLAHEKSQLEVYVKQMGKTNIPA